MTVWAGMRGLLADWLTPTHISGEETVGTPTTEQLTSSNWEVWQVEQVNLVGICRRTMAEEVMGGWDKNCSLERQVGISPGTDRHRNRDRDGEETKMFPSAAWIRGALA